MIPEISECEVCSGDGATAGWLVKGLAFGERARLCLCPDCQLALGVATDTSAGLVPTGREPSWRAVAWLTAAVAFWGFSAVVAWGHFFAGAAVALALVLAYSDTRQEKPDELSGAPRRPAIDPVVERVLSNTKLLAHLRAVSDFPEEDFLMLRPNSALARKLQRERAKQTEPPHAVAVYIDSVITDCKNCDGNIWCDCCLEKHERGVGRLVCPDPRQNVVVRDRPTPTSIPGPGQKRAC